MNTPPQPVFPDQPENVQVLWGYGLHGNEVGDFIKKPMTECTGAEILQELLYHMDYLNHYDEVLDHTKIITSMLPYITSQFMEENQDGVVQDKDLQGSDHKEKAAASPDDQKQVSDKALLAGNKFNKNVVFYLVKFSENGSLLKIMVPDHLAGFSR